jgi:hypothetical protein
VTTDFGTDTTNILTTDVFETNLVDNALDYEVWAASWAPPTADAISVVQMIPTTPYFNYDPILGRQTVSNIEFERTKEVANSVPEGRRVLLATYWHSALAIEPIWQSIEMQNYYADPARDGIAVTPTKNILSPWMDTELADIKTSVSSFIDKCDANNIKFDYISDDSETWGRFSIWSLYIPQSEEPCIACGSTTDFSSVAVSKVGCFQCITSKVGNVDCWWDRDYALSIGFVDNGQCTVPSNLPPCKQIACGYGHTLALTVDGKLIAWGADGSGQGKKGTEAIQDQITAAGRTVTKIDCGASHNVALLDDGQVVVWGANEGAQLSDPDTYWTNKDSPNFGGVGYPGGYQPQQNELFKYHQEYSPIYTCDANGNCNRVHRCADSAEIANNQRDSASGCESPYRSAAQRILNGETPFLDWQGNQIPGGRAVANGLFNNGWETVTGAPYDYQFSRETTGDEESVNFSNGGWVRNADTKSALGFSPKTYIDVKAGRTHVIALADDGTIDTWGSNYYYAITGSGAHGWDGRTPCNYTTCFRPTTWNSTTCSNCFGRAGSGNPNSSATIVATWGHRNSAAVKSIKTFGVVRHIGTSYYNSAIVANTDLSGTSFGTVTPGNIFVWDRNEHAESVPDITLPNGGIPAGPYKQVTGGYHHFVALRENGSVVCWGENSNGECNVPTELSSPTSPLDEVVWVGAGRRCTLARTKSGKLIGWGDMRALGGQAKLDTLSLPQQGGTRNCWDYTNRHCTGVYLTDENALFAFVQDPRFEGKLIPLFATEQAPLGRSLSDVFFERYSALMIQAGEIPAESSIDALSPLFGVEPNVIPWANTNNKSATRAWNSVIIDLALGYYRAKMWEDVLQDKGWTDTKLGQYGYYPLTVEQTKYFEDYNGGNWSEPRQFLNNWMVSPWFYGWLGQLEQSAAYYLNPVNDEQRYSYVKVPAGSTLPSGVVRYNSPVWLTFLNEMRQLRSILNSSPTAWEKLVPWITGPLTGHQGGSNETAYKYFYDQRYWKEIVLHLILHGTKFFNYWETYGYRTGGCIASEVNEPWCTHDTQYRQSTQLHNVLEEWRLQSGNSRSQPITLNNIAVNTNLIVSGGKLLKSNLYLWRLTASPNSGNYLRATGTSESRTDIPQLIEIPTDERGVWLLTASSQVPEYIVSETAGTQGDIIHLNDLNPVVESQKEWILKAFYGANPSETDQNPYGLPGKGIDYLSNANIIFNYKIYEGHEVYTRTNFHIPSTSVPPIIIKTGPSTTQTVSNSPCYSGLLNYATPSFTQLWFTDEMYKHGEWGEPIRKDRPFPNSSSTVTVNPVLVEGTEIYPTTYNPTIPEDYIGEPQRSVGNSTAWWNLSENLPFKDNLTGKNYHLDGFDKPLPETNSRQMPGMTYKWTGDTHAPILEEDGTADHYYFDRYEQWLLNIKAYNENLYTTKTLTESQNTAICPTSQLFAPNIDTILSSNFQNGVFKPQYLHLDFESALTNMMMVDATTRWGIVDTAKPVHTIYVSTTGNDNNDGLTLSTPVGSFQKAANLAKSYTGPLNVVIRIRGGTYRLLEESFYMDETYTLSNGRTITFKPHNNEEVIISGAYRLNTDEFTLVTESSNPSVWNKLPENARGNVYEINLCGYDLGIVPLWWRGDRFVSESQLPALPELVFNNNLMTLARWPNKTTGEHTEFKFESCAVIENVIETGLEADFNTVRRDVDAIFTYPSSYDSVVANWDVDKGIWLHGFWKWDWQDEVYKVLDIDKANRRIKVYSRKGTYGILNTAPCPPSGDGTYRPTNPSPRRWFAFNFLYGLDSPGEYYIDRETRKMYFWPPSSINSSTKIEFTSRAMAGPSQKKDSSTLESGLNRYTGNACINCDSSIQGHECCDYTVPENGCTHNTGGTDCTDRQVGPLGQDLSNDGCEYIYNGWVKDPRIPGSGGWYQSGGAIHSRTGFNTKNSFASLFKFVKVKNVVIEGLKFVNTSGSGIHLHNCKNVKINKSVFNNIRRRGINAEGGKSIKIDSCAITNIGLGGVVLTGGNRQKIISANHKISNCIIKNFSLRSYIGTLGISMTGVGIRATKNLIENGGTAINPAGNDNVVEYNYIKNIGNHGDDWGAVYTGRNMSSRNITIKNNFFKNCKSLLPGSVSYPCTKPAHTHGNAAIYFDDRESGHNIESNVFYDCGSGDFGAVFFNGGVYHNIINNVFVDCPIAIAQPLYNVDRWNGDEILNSVTQVQSCLNPRNEPWYEDGGPLDSNNAVIAVTDYTPWTYYASADGKNVWDNGASSTGAFGLFNKVDIRKDAYQYKYETIRKQFNFTGSGLSSRMFLNPTEINNMKNIVKNNVVTSGTLLTRADVVDASGTLVGGFDSTQNAIATTQDFVEYPTNLKFTRDYLTALEDEGVQFSKIKLDKIQKEDYSIPSYIETIETPTRIYGTLSGKPFTREMFYRFLSYVKLLRKMVHHTKKIFPETKVYFYSPILWNTYQSWTLNNASYPTNGGMWSDIFLSPENCTPSSSVFTNNCIDPLFEGGVVESCEEAGRYIQERVKKSASAITKLLTFVNNPEEDDVLVLNEFKELYPQLTDEDIRIKDLNYYPNSSIDLMTDNTYNYYSLTLSYKRSGVSGEENNQKLRTVVENQVNTINSIGGGRKYGPMFATTIQGVCGSDVWQGFYYSYNGSHTWKNDYSVNNCNSASPDTSPCGKRERRDRSFVKYAPKIHMSLPEIYKYQIAPAVRFDPGIMFNWDAFQSYDSVALTPLTPKNFYDQKRPCQAGELPCDENCLDYIQTGTPDPCNPTTRKFNGCADCRPLQSIPLSGTPRATGLNLSTIQSKPYITPYRIAGRRPSDWSRRVSGAELNNSGPEFKLRLNPWYTFLSQDTDPVGGDGWENYCYYWGRDIRTSGDATPEGTSGYSVTPVIFSRRNMYNLACEFAGYDDSIAIPYKDITNDSYWVGYYGSNGDFDPYITAAGATTNTNVNIWPWYRRSQTSKRIEALSITLNIKKHHDLVKYVNNPEQRYSKQWPIKPAKFPVDRRPIMFNAQSVSAGCGSNLAQTSWGFGSNGDCCNYGFGAFWKKCVDANNQPIPNTGLQKLIEQTLTYQYNLPAGGNLQPELPVRRFMIWVPCGVVYKNQSCSDGYTSAITSSMKLRVVEGIDYTNPTGPLKKYVNPSESCWKNITTPVILDAAEHARNPSNPNNQLFIPATATIAESLPLCSDNPSVPCFEPEGRLNEWMTCLGKWIRERPDAEVGLYIGYTIPLDGGVGGNPPKPKSGEIGIQGAAGGGPNGQNVLWAIPDPENNADHRAFLETELSPWFNIGIKTIGLDVGFGVANYQNGGTIAPGVSRTPVGDYQAWLKGRWPQLSKIFGEAIPYDYVAPVVDEYNKPIPAGRIGGNMPRKSFYSTPVDEVCKGIKVGSESGFNDNTVFVDNCWKLTDAFGTVHDTKGRERFRRLNADGADYGPDSIKYSAGAYQYCGYIGLVSGNLNQSWIGPGCIYDKTKPINWYGLDPNEMWCWDKQTTEVVAMFENLGTLSPSIGNDYWRIPAWHNGPALPIQANCTTPGNGCLSTQPNVFGGKDDGRQYDVNSLEYQYVKNEIFEAVKNYIDRGYVGMFSTYSTEFPLYKELLQEIFEYIHQNERDTTPFAKDLPPAALMAPKSKQSPVSPLFKNEIEIFEILEEERPVTSTDTSEGTNETTNN